MPKKGNLNKYKTLVIAIIIVIIVIILDIIFENYSNTSIQKVNGSIEKIYNIFKEEKELYEAQNLKEISKTARQEWRKREKILSCFIEHDEIEKINIKLDTLYTQINNKNWVDSKTTISELKRLVKYLDGKYELNIQNIF